MEKKKQIKISFKIVLLILVIFIAIVIGFSLIQKITNQYLLMEKHIIKD